MPSIHPINSVRIIDYQTPEKPRGSITKYQVASATIGVLLGLISLTIAALMLMAACFVAYEDQRLAALSLFLGFAIPFGFGVGFAGMAHADLFRTNRLPQALAYGRKSSRFMLAAVVIGLGIALLIIAGALGLSYIFRGPQSGDFALTLVIAICGVFVSVVCLFHLRRRE